MIKGINLQVIEVNETGCDYFDKILFFIKPEYSFVSESKLREQISKITSSAAMQPNRKQKKKRLGMVGLVASIICLISVGISMGFLITHFLN